MSDKFILGLNEYAERLELVSEKLSKINALCNDLKELGVFVDIEKMIINMDDIIDSQS